MQIPRLDPLPLLLTEAVTRAKMEDRDSVAEAATAAQLEPVGSRGREQGRDPTLDPTRQRRERGDLTQEERRRRESQSPPAETRESELPSLVTVDAMERATLGAAGPAPKPLGDLDARALDLIHEWGRARIQSGELDGRGPTAFPLAAARPGPSADPLHASLRRIALRAYKQHG
jgi:hypothetical protein